MLHHDRARAESFGSDAERYDRARPAYPPELVDRLLAHDPASVLDVGCGTGIAAALLAQRGVGVLGVEADERMARVARAKGIEVEVARFEEWDARGRRFDLLTCAQAWHWIEPRAGIERAAEVLAEDGRLAVFWNLGSPPDPLAGELRAIYMRLAPDIERYSVLLGNREPRVGTITSALAASSRFEPPALECYSWTRRYSAAEWLEHLLTHSDHKTLAPHVREQLQDAVAAEIDRAGGAIEMLYDCWLVSARVRPGSADG